MHTKKIPDETRRAVKHRVCYWVHHNVAAAVCSSHVMIYRMKRLNQHDEMFNEKGPSAAARLNSAQICHRRCSTKTGH